MSQDDAQELDDTHELDDTELVDPTVLSKLRMLRAFQKPDQPDLVTTLIDMFLQDTPERLMLMRQALVQQDAGELERVAHSLRGSCANLGAKTLADICAKIEAHAHDGTLTGVTALLDEIVGLFGETRGYLEQQRRA